MSHLFTGLCAVLFLGIGVAQISAEEYRDHQYNFTLDYGDAWESVEPNVPVRQVLVCKCGNEIRAFINATYTPQLATMTTSDFFENITPAMVPNLVRQMVASIGQVTKTHEVEKGRIGNIEGYIGHFSVKYKNSRERELIYGMAFQNGYFYHLQVFAPPQQFEILEQKAAELFKGFRLD